MNISPVGYTIQNKRKATKNSSHNWDRGKTEVHFSAQNNSSPGVSNNKNTRFQNLSNLFNSPQSNIKWASVNALLGSILLPFVLPLAISFFAVSASHLFVAAVQYVSHLVFPKSKKSPIKQKTKQTESNPPTSKPCPSHIQELNLKIKRLMEDKQFQASNKSEFFENYKAFTDKIPENAKTYRDISTEAKDHLRKAIYYSLTSTSQELQNIGKSLALEIGMSPDDIQQFTEAPPLPIRRLIIKSR